jgi:hypothetical protein
MKKLVLLLGLMFALQAAMMAQNTTGNIIFNAHLNQTFNLIIDLGTPVDQEITFATAADYNNGVVAGAGIQPGSSQIQVEATEDWNLTMGCPDFLITGGGTETIPIGNLGYVISENAGHGNNDEVLYTPGLIMMTNATTTALISVGPNGNAGDISDNDFTLTWEMGTAALQGMNLLGSMFDQMANGDFTTGDYQAIALLTLTPAP